MVLRRYFDWLHLQWPAGLVEKLPQVNEDGSTNVPGLFVVGDLTGIPLLKFAADGGARVAQGLKKFDTKELDVVIIGGGVAGISAAIEAKKRGLSFRVFEAKRPFATIEDFPKAKPIFTYPTDLTPRGDLQVGADVKEDLFAELESQREAHGIEVEPMRVTGVGRMAGQLQVQLASGGSIAAHQVIVAIGKSGNHRKLDAPGEDLPHVFNRLHDPKDYDGQSVLVVGGGDSALEAAIALAEAGAKVSLSYRGKHFTRPKPENSERVMALHNGAQTQGSLQCLFESKVARIEEGRSVLSSNGIEQSVDAEVVFSLIGREAPLEFFRRSGVPILGEWRWQNVAAFASFFAFCFFVYTWKAGGSLTQKFRDNGWFPFNVPGWLAGLSEAATDKTTLLGTLSTTLEEPGFYYSLAYTVAVLVFGVARIRRRKTPYITWQTSALMAIQLVPLFLLPYVVLPYLGNNGMFDAGFGKTVADNLFPEAGYGHGREYWRAFGLILAWPLFIWNFFTHQPLWWWLAIGMVQTFVLIPWLVWRYGKGAYCGWICSCGALAETLGDTHRQKMPHGPIPNRLNFIGQAALALALLLMVTKSIAWASPGSAIGSAAAKFHGGLLSGWAVGWVPLNYYHVVDIFLAGIVGVGFYFWFSGRVWCRFACPLAALMHIYARFSRFRIFADKKKCISCNVCTSVCHQGIDVMAFANKGEAMEDPQCVRCSACVQSCPTGTLSFGRLDGDGKPVLDTLPASPVQMREQRKSLPIVG